SRGQAAEAARLWDAAAERATVGNQVSIAVESRVLAGMARAGGGRLEEAQASLDAAAVSARAAGIPMNEFEANGFRAHVASRRRATAAAGAVGRHRRHMVRGGGGAARLRPRRAAARVEARSAVSVPSAHHLGLGARGRAGARTR